MVIKRKAHTPTAYITLGMVFFLISIIATQIADSRHLGALINEMVGDDSRMRIIQGFADGFALPMLFASIFFNLRGLILQKSQNST